MGPLATYLALQDRDLTPYVPSEASVNTVRVIVLEAGHADAGPYEVSGAYIDLGARPCTVGDVAEHVIRRRAPEARAIGMQTSLFE